MNQKMSFNEFILKTREKYGMDEDDWGPYSKCAVVRFDYDSKGCVSGEYKGVIVYRDSSYESTILPGDTWICSLKRNPGFKVNYFAKPLERVDASFVFSLMEEQREVIVDSIWDAHREEMMPMLEEKFKDVIEERVKTAEEKIVKEDRQTIDDLKDVNAELNTKLIENDVIIESLQTQIEELKKENKVLIEAGVKIKKEIVKQPEQPVEEHPPQEHTVVRISPDAIQSDLFTKSRYFVHMSPDQRMIVIRPSDKGNVICMNNTIELAGLSFVSNFVEKGEMITQYDNKGGAIQIRLK